MYLGKDVAGIPKSLHFPVACLLFQEDKLPEGCETRVLDDLFGKEAFTAITS